MECAPSSDAVLVALSMTLVTIKVHVIFPPGQLPVLRQDSQFSSPNLGVCAGRHDTQYRCRTPRYLEVANGVLTEETCTVMRHVSCDWDQNVSPHQLQPPRLEDRNTLAAPLAMMQVTEVCNPLTSPLPKQG